MNGGSDFAAVRALAVRQRLTTPNMETRMRLRRLLCFAVVAFGLAIPPMASADMVLVNANSSGGFGSPADGGTALTLGHTFTAAGQSIMINAHGLINLNTAFGDTYLTGPDGLTLERSLIIGGGVSAYTPLEEKLVDAGNPPPISDGASLVENVGALFGAFVPLPLTSTPGYSAFDSDIVPVGIDSAALFLIGAGPYTFTSTGAGTLYFGINEPFVSNNSGEFSVNISAVPEPGSATLMGLGTLGLIGYGRRRRRDVEPRRRPESSLWNPSSVPSSLAEGGSISA